MLALYILVFTEVVVFIKLLNSLLYFLYYFVGADPEKKRP